jgi:hypothetical protein
MKQVKNPLFQWSLTLALLSGVLGRLLLRSDSPVMEISLWLQTVVVLLLVLLTVTGIVLGALSWKRRELNVGWIIVVIVLNAVEFLLIFLRLSTLSEG